MTGNADAASTLELYVPPLAKRIRLDVWMAERLKGNDPVLSRSRLQTLIRSGAVEVNGIPILDPKHALHGEEALTLAIPPVRSSIPLPEAIPIDVLHEDDDLIVLVKPVGMVVHPGAGVHSGTLVNALLHHCAGSLSGIGGVARPGIVHRLDRDTSGVMVVAKNDAAHQSLSEQFADHGRTGPLERSYLAMVWGSPTPPAGTIDAPLGRDTKDRTRRAVSDANDARAARTHYATEKRLGLASLVRCRLETGRTHQIRVHMAHIGHPLLGDRTYGTSQRSRANALGPAAREAVEAIPGQALHAASLRFSHPRTGETMRFESPPPITFSAVLGAFDKTGR